MSLKLPALLASLPSGGKHALVRPAHWPTDSFYRVTRSKLRFRLAAPAAAQASGSGSAGSAGSAGEASGSALDGADGAGGAGGAAADDVGEVKVSGKAWGQLVWKGRLVPPASPLASPAPLLRGALKHRWAPVDAGALDARARAAADDAAARYDELEAAREAAFAARKAAGPRARAAAGGLA